MPYPAWFEACLTGLTPEQRDAYDHAVWVLYGNVSPFIGADRPASAAPERTAILGMASFHCTMERGSHIAPYPLGHTPPPGAPGVT